MDIVKFRNASARLLPDQQVSITFTNNPQGFKALRCLMEMAATGRVRFENFSLAQGVTQSRLWNKSGRTFVVWLEHGVWQDCDLLSHVEQGLEHVMAVGVSVLSGLHYGRLREREAVSEAMRVSLRNCTDYWENEYGLSATFQRHEVAGFHLLGLVLRDGDEAIVSLCFDGWSGNLLSVDLYDGEVYRIASVVGFCSTIGDVVMLINDEVNKSLEADKI